MSAKSAAALAVVCVVFYLNKFCLSQKLDNVVCGTIGHQFYGRNLTENDETTFRMCVKACRNNTNCNAVNYWSSNKTCRLIQTESRRWVTGCDDCISSFIKKECAVATEPSYPMKYTFVLPELTAPFRLRFTVRAAFDGIVALATGRTYRDVFCHITLGGWSNTKAALRTGDLSQGTDLTTQSESNDPRYMLSADEDRAFWIEYENGSVRVGKDGERDAFLEWDGTEEVGSHSKVDIAISTYKWTGGEWVFDQNCE